MNGIMGTKKPKQSHSEAEEAPRIRIAVDATSKLKLAIDIRAGKETVRRLRKVSSTEIVNELLEQALSEELKELARGER